MTIKPNGITRTALHPPFRVSESIIVRIVYFTVFLTIVVKVEAENT